MSGTRTSTGTGDGTATVAFALPNLTFGSTMCTFNPTAVTGGVGGIAAGRYWTTFHCTDASRANSSDLCDIDGEIRVRLPPAVTATPSSLVSSPRARARARARARSPLSFDQSRRSPVNPDSKGGVHAS